MWRKHGGGTGVKEANSINDQRWLESHTKGDNRGGGARRGPWIGNGSKLVSVGIPQLVNDFDPR